MALIGSIETAQLRLNGHQPTQDAVVGEQIQVEVPLPSVSPPSLTHPRLDPLEASIHDANELQRRERPPRQRPQDVALLGVIDIPPVLAQHADPEGDLLYLLHRLLAEQPQGIRQIEIEDRIHPRATGLQPAHGNLS